MEPIREKILEYLQNRQQATTAELSHSLMVTRADVRYHLKIMEQSGAVEKSLSAKPASRGRPEFLYALSNRSLPDNYSGLAGVLLEVLSQSAEPSKFLTQIAGLVLKQTTQAKRSTLPGDLTNRLNQLGYQARWEASSHGPRIIFRNCPYISLVADYPVLCQMDVHILENFLHTPFSQTAKINRAGGQGHQCVFKANPTG